jgi:predicted phosphate transport protein (TIGR00153 family)
MRLAFLPREEKFFFLLHQSAMNIQKVAIKLQDLMEDYTNVPAKVEEIKVLEEFGDEAIHQIMQALHRTFVTPLDREDIAHLAERLDDVVDAIEEAARTMLEYQVEAPTVYAIEMSRVITQCGEHLEKAVSLLSSRGSKLKEILPHTVELNRLENQGDQINSRAMGALFTNSGNDAISILKWRDIYAYLEDATDRAEDAANVLEAIVLKHA